MKHLIVHNLELLRSRQLIEKAFAEYQRRYARYSPSLAWRDERRADFGFTAKGMTLTGSLDLRPRELEIAMDVPFFLRVFKGQAMKILDREVQRILSAASEGAVAPERGVI